MKVINLFVRLRLPCFFLENDSVYNADNELLVAYKGAVTQTTELYVTGN